MSCWLYRTDTKRPTVVTKLATFDLSSGVREITTKIIIRFDPPGHTRQRNTRSRKGDRGVSWDLKYSTNNTGVGYVGEIVLGIRAPIFKPCSFSRSINTVGFKTTASRVFSIPYALVEWVNIAPSIGCLIEAMWSRGMMSNFGDEDITYATMV